MRVLVVVDMQNDFIDGALGTPEAQAIVGNVVKKIEEFDGAIAVTHDTHHDSYLDTQEGRLLPVKHCIEMTDGWRLNPDVYAALDKRHESGAKVEVFMKPTFGSLELGDWLKNMDCHNPVEEIILVGLCTDICVISNAMIIKAFLPEVKVTVDSACCAGVTPGSHENALRAMKICQVNIENWEG